MILSPTFFNQVRLLVATLPQIHKEDCFALKGGTAINLFIRDMPRLSVDIDLAYIPIENRSASLSKIDSALKRIGKSIVRYIPGVRVTENTMHNTSYCNRIQVRGENTIIKIEVTPVLRGSIHYETSPSGASSSQITTTDTFAHHPRTGYLQRRFFNLL